MSHLACNLTREALGRPIATDLSNTHLVGGHIEGVLAGYTQNQNDVTLYVRDPRDGTVSQVLGVPLDTVVTIHGVPNLDADAVVDLLVGAIEQGLHLNDAQDLRLSFGGWYDEDRFGIDIVNADDEAVAAYSLRISGGPDELDDEDTEGGAPDA
jgi:hypothetical protein